MNTDTSKTVDVVMCTYNGEKFLREQLDSIVSQTYPISRLIVQDDRSTDGTVAIVREYAARHSFIELYVNPENLGYNLNFKTAVMRTTADFVAISDQDDVWFADKIERQVTAIGQYNICFSAHTRGESMGNTHVVRPQYGLKALLFHGFAGHTMLLKGEFARNPGAWMPHMIYDWGLAVKAYLTDEPAIARIDEPLNWHRSYPDETAQRQHTERMKAAGHGSGGPLAAYMHGLKHYRRLQQKPAWQLFYKAIADEAPRHGHATEGLMAALMLRNGAAPLLRLCLLCARHRREAYPDPAKAAGAMGVLRGFFMPFIFAFNNTEFDD